MKCRDIVFKSATLYVEEIEECVSCDLHIPRRTCLARDRHRQVLASMSTKEKFFDAHGDVARGNSR